MKPAAERVMQQTGGFRMQCKECEAAARRRQTRRMDVEGRERCAQGRQATNRRCVLPRGVAVAVVRLEILITLHPACLPAMHGSHRSEPCSASAFEDGVRRVRRVRRVPCCAGCDRLAESVGARMRQPEYVALLRWHSLYLNGALRDFKQQRKSTMPARSLKPSAIVAPQSHSIAAQHAACSMQHAPGSMQHAKRMMQHATRMMLHATRTRQHAT